MIMSGRIVGEVFDCAPADLTPAERLVLLALAEGARDGERIARYSASKIADMTQLKPGTIKNALASLAQRAIIQPQHRAQKYRSQDYRITPLSGHHRSLQSHRTVTQTEPEPDPSESPTNDPETTAQGHSTVTQLPVDNSPNGHRPRHLRVTATSSQGHSTVTPTRKTNP